MQGLNPIGGGGGRDFMRLLRLALGPTHPIVQQVPVLFPYSFSQYIEGLSRNINHALGEKTFASNHT